MLQGRERPAQAFVEVDSIVHVTRLQGGDTS